MTILERNPADWEDFEVAAKRSVEQHIRNPFVHTHKPFLDDAQYRSFNSMEEYRRWCEENLPGWLGCSRD